MREENIFFMKGRDFCTKTVQICSPSDAVRDVARKMSEKNISSIFVCEDGVPIGIITDRDFRNKIVPSGMNAKEVEAAGIMSSPLVTIREDEYLFEAIYKMSRHNIHRVAIVDGEGKLKGVLTDSDILRLQTDTPQYLIRDIEHAETVEELRRISRKVTDLVVHLNRTGVRTMDLVRLIAHINDAVVQRLVAILRSSEFPELPRGFAFVVLGSEGRMEQTLKTDQDNAIIYADDLGEEEQRLLARFSTRLIDSLISTGVPPCPGGIMAKNEFWRQSLSQWTERLTAWTSVPNPDNILNFSMFSDVRLLFGDPALVQSLRDCMGQRVRESTLFVAHMAKNILRFPPPLGWFGRLRLEAEGEHRGTLNIKKAGVFALTEGAKLLALSAGVSGVGTWERIVALGEAGELSPDEVLGLQASYNYLVYVRLRSQVSAVIAGQKPSDFVDPRSLNFIEMRRLRDAFGAVKSFQNLLKLRYRLDFIRN